MSKNGILATISYRFCVVSNQIHTESNITERDITQSFLLL